MPFRRSTEVRGFQQTFLHEGPAGASANVTSLSFGFMLGEQGVATLELKAYYVPEATGFCTPSVGSSSLWAIPQYKNGSDPFVIWLPTACELVTPADVEMALGVAVRKEGSSVGRDRCRHASDRADQVEITVDRPGIVGAVVTYRALNPGAELVTGIGEEGALVTGTSRGELVFVKDRTRFFVVVASPLADRDSLLILGRRAAARM